MAGLDAKQFFDFADYFVFRLLFLVLVLLGAVALIKHAIKTIR